MSTHIFIENFIMLSKFFKENNKTHKIISLNYLFVEYVCLIIYFPKFIDMFEELRLKSHLN